MRFNRRNSSAADRDASRPDTLNCTPPSVENMLRDRGDPPPAAQAPLGPTTTMPPQPGRANAQTSAPKSPASGIGARGTTTTGARESRPCLGAATPTLILLRFSEWHEACNNTRLSECYQNSNSPGWPPLSPSMLKPLPRFPSWRPWPWASPLGPNHELWRLPWKLIDSKPFPMGPQDGVTTTIYPFDANRNTRLHVGCLVKSGLEFHTGGQAARPSHPGLPVWLRGSPWCSDGHGQGGGGLDESRPDPASCRGHR